MTSKYISRATPKAYESAKELVGLWRTKMDRTKGAFEAEGDLQAATMVSLSNHGYKLMYRMLSVRLTEYIKMKRTNVKRQWHLENHSVQS